MAIGGPGTLLVQAGRNIGPLSNQQEIFDIEGEGAFTSPTTGIDAIGNADDPFLPHESANVQVLFGTGPGIDTSPFINAYIAPGASVPGIDTTPELISFMEQFDEGAGVDTGLVADVPVVTLSADQAWSQFQALPLRVQQLFAEDVLFNVLQTVGNDFNNSSSPFFHQYERGYQAINTLFPASFGYYRQQPRRRIERRQQCRLDRQSRYPLDDHPDPAGWQCHDPRSGWRGPRRQRIRPAGHRQLTREGRGRGLAAKAS